MTAKPTYLVQTFKKVRGGHVVPGDREAAPTATGAIKKAEAMSARFPGTAALAILADAETGELQSGTILAAFGEMPEDFADSLRGG